ncbi:ExeM/NucH family extracellular endonuclease [Halomonas sp. MCCC 1A17488]|uniref:ExeM/NucH family extracellular endonuclease n=1 Tax=unclassified Halomonas TaxID=2609666 RepID=UPI0018D22099|nr:MULTISPECIES: ExeM/NucH family extracellular endonuclease [unclassified Halomonas]MCE8016223.1 ExeM/NucH family extracellular endonuclease [Halomonas sp. MCCC 1A17488]MCG3239556.1 ExeM/NucH family extracellular endonuclease [Halomonas sp. MCCC 1A17488]QPP50524.1 ExeM/NucH family extracellular endonuclease [Halomonas sp. SS10-MC5]
MTFAAPPCTPGTRRHPGVTRQAGPLTLLLALLLAAPAAASCPDPSSTDLAAIKGIGERTALPADREVIVDGVVTGEFLGRERLNGFYLQQATEHGPVGLFVYMPGATPSDGALIAPGTHLQLHARTGEYRGQIQLQRVERIETCARDQLPEPLAVDWPLSEEQLSRKEGLLLTFPQALTVTGNDELARYGSLWLAANRLFRPTNTPGETQQRDTLALDDGSYRAFASPIPYLDANGTRRVGSTVEGLTGILTHAFDAYRLHPTLEPRFEDANPRPGPLPAPGARLRVATFNVENYFISLGQRGAANATELERQRAKLAAAVEGLQADILALVEVENDPRALADLVEQLGERTGIRYRAVDGNADRGSDAIKLALLYRPDRVEAMSELYADNDPAHHRPPLAAFFRSLAGGPAFGVVTAHFKSKTGCPPSGDIDRGQGCWNQRRVEQSEAMSAFLARLAEAEGHERLLLTGDLNAYGAEDPVRTLVHAGLVDLIARELPPERRYSYVFRGESGYLDHALASPELAAAVAEVRPWPINADEPAFLGYDGPDNAAPHFRPDSFRSSDHDPIAVDLEWR